MVKQEEEDDNEAEESVGEEKDKSNLSHESLSESAARNLGKGRITSYSLATLHHMYTALSISFH